MALKYEDIKQEFMDTVNNDQVCQKLYAKIRSGDASYKTGSQLAARIGEDLGKVLKKYAPQTSVYEWDLNDLLPKSLGLDHQMVITACNQIQEQMNKDAGLGIKPKSPKFDWNRVDGMIKELEEHADNFQDIEKSFWDQLANFSQNIVDDSIRDNAQMLARAGVKTQVIRQAEFKACPWCRDVAGVYDYTEVKNQGNDVWRRHENCRCTIDYITEYNGSMYRERTGAGIGLRVPQQ
jgi:hypothetical protein